MDLTQNRRAILFALTADWQTPFQITAKLPNGDIDIVNQTLKELLQKGFVQVNPVVLGTYRLTSDGASVKEDLQDELS